MSGRNETWCGKIKHESNAKALAAAVAAKKSKKRREGGIFGSKSRDGLGAKISVYRCNICGFYHWGHRVKNYEGKRGKGKNKC